MGMFLTKYGMLNLLAGKSSKGQGNAEWWREEQYKATINLLSKYKLTGFIIHDKENHTEFDSKLERIFPKLDFVTGEHFLFFGLINPSKEWVGMAKGRDYFGVWEKHMLLNPGNAYEVNDQSITAYTIANSLNIDYEDLPVIVLTPNLSERKFFVVKTCPLHLEEQLTEIGFYCSQRKEDDIAISDLADLKKNIDLCSGFYSDILNKPIAEILANLLSFIVSAKSDSFDLTSARENTAVVLKSAFKKSFLLVERSDQIKEQLALIGCLANMQPTNKTFAESFESYNIEPVEVKPHFSNTRRALNLDEGCESESRIVWETYKKVSPVYSELVATQADDKCLRDLDYSPLVICLSKIFEIETNLSIVHWIRYHLSIEMPEFYKRKKITHEQFLIKPSSKFTSDPRPVDFNKGREEKWIAPGIGESELVFKSLIAEGIRPIEKFEEDILLNAWKVIRKTRNIAAHNGVINQKLYKGTTSAFNDLLSSNYFHTANALKLKFKRT